MFRTAFNIDRASAGLDLGNTHDKACAVGESGCEDARVGAVLLKAELFAVVGPADALYLCIDTVEVLPAGIRLLKMCIRDRNTSPRAKNRTKIFFAKRKKMRGNYCNSRSNVIKLTKIDGFIE